MRQTCHYANIPDMNTDSIEKLDHAFKELLEDGSLATQEAVENLQARVQELKNSVLGTKSTISRLYAASKQLDLYFKIRNFESLLKTLKGEAGKNSHALQIDKVIRDLQKRGFLLPMAKEACFDACRYNKNELAAINCKSTFNFNIVDKETGLLELLVYTLDGKTAAYPLPALSDFQAHIKKHAQDAIPLSQLQDISGWLHNHGRSNLITLDALENKLESLIHSCPHGAYVLHTQNKILTLSRLSPRGQIEHVTINLFKEPGIYTLQFQGQEFAATRAQFKKRLTQMGTPVRVKAL